MLVQETHQTPRRVDHDQMANPRRQHVLRCFVDRGSRRDGSHRAGHEFRDVTLLRIVASGINPGDVALGDDADGTFCFDHHHAGGPAAIHQMHRLPQAGVRRQGEDRMPHDTEHGAAAGQQRELQVQPEIGFADHAYHLIPLVDQHQMTDTLPQGELVSRFHGHRWRHGNDRG